MPLIPWTGQLLTGHPEMDAQHRSLVDSLNTLFATRGEEAAQRGTLLHQLHAEIEFHFQWEEALMGQHHYPDALEHRTQHNLKRLQVANLLFAHRAGLLEADPGWMEKTAEWFVHQILNEDQALADFLLG